MYEADPLYEQFTWPFLHAFQTATGDNREIYSILERIMSVSTAVGQAFKDDEIAKDVQLTFYAKQLLL